MFGNADENNKYQLFTLPISKKLSLYIWWLTVKLGTNTDRCARMGVYNICLSILLYPLNMTVGLRYPLVMTAHILNENMSLILGNMDLNMSSLYVL